MACDREVGWLLDEIVDHSTLEMGEKVVIEYPYDFTMLA